jgi:L-alanine-DL-glutamate epimerase-like enolase superfamily enzyme
MTAQRVTTMALIVVLGTRAGSGQATVVIQIGETLTHTRHSDSRGAEFSPLVEQRDIDFARAPLPDVGGITEMLKIMAVCDTHKVGIVPHFTGSVATAGHMHTMMAFPGQMLMEYNQGERPVPYMPDFLECRNGKVWPRVN